MKCRHCHAPMGAPFLDLGTSPASNAYLRAEELESPERWFPLRLHVCESCWLVQTADYSDREALFTSDYAYFSSTSSTWLDHARRYSDAMCTRLALGPNSQVVEIAANDGYLLQYFQARGIPCYGVEPTTSTAQAARSRGLDIVEDFFGTQLAQTLAATKGPADLMVANNVLAHVPDINDFVAGFAVLLAQDGTATFEFPHLLELVKGQQFDTVYHEHYSYLSLLAVQRIFNSQGLVVFDVEALPTHGGSLRVFAQHAKTGKWPISPAVEATLVAEREAGCLTRSFYAQLQTHARRIKSQLLSFLLQAQSQGLQVEAYGAAAKGNTLLNYAGVGPDLIACVYDAAPSKQGKFLPGSRIPILPPDHMAARRPDIVLILPWNIQAEVAHQLQFTNSWGARLMVAVPELHEVGVPKSGAIAPK